MTARSDDAMRKPYRVKVRMLRLLFIFLIFSFGIAKAELPLDLIQIFRSDSAGAMLKKGCMSPGDLDGDGFNEYEFFETIYVSEYDELGVPCTLAGDYADRCGDLPTLPTE